MPVVVVVVSLVVVVALVVMMSLGVVPLVVMPLGVVSLVAIELAIVAAVVVVVVVVGASRQPSRAGGEQTEGAEAQHLAQHKQILLKGLIAQRWRMQGIVDPDLLNQTPAGGVG